ncbi:MAG: hypothetical protein H7Y39_08810 [Nitrospiraceae bacterium]|nr:hypothetical protein [Nitrospiraceae bacterium]
MTTLSLESVVAIVSGIVTILTGLCVLLGFIYRTFRTFPQDPERSPSRQTKNHAVRQPAPRYEPKESYSDQYGQAVATRSPAGPSSWKSIRDRAGDVAPFTILFLGFSLIVSLAVKGKVATGTLFSFFVDQNSFSGFLSSLLLGAIASYLAGCFIAVFLYGSTGRALRRTRVAVIALSTAGMIFGWLASELQGLALGLVSGVLLGLLPIVSKGIGRYFNRVIARSLIRSALADPTGFSGSFGRSAGYGCGFLYASQSHWNILREVALVVGIDHRTVEQAKDNSYDLYCQSRERIDAARSTRERQKRSERHLDED